MALIKCVDCGNMISDSSEMCVHCGCPTKKSMSPIENFVIENGKLIKYLGKSKDVIIPNGVVEIGEDAFKNSKGILSITFSETVEKIESEGCAFSFCRMLKAFYVDKNNKNYCSIDGNLYNKSGKKLIAYACAKKNKEVIIPEGVEEIGNSAFRFNVNVYTVICPNTLQTIGEEAFRNCRLCRIALNDGLKIIKQSAFRSCSLIKIDIPKTVTIIEDNALNFKNDGHFNLAEAKKLHLEEFYLKEKESRSRLLVKGVAGGPAEEYAKRTGMKFEPIKEKLPIMQSAKCCANCAHWRGDRTFNDFLGRAEVDSTGKGICANMKGYYNQPTRCRATCPAFTRHPAIRD